jgi:hypothetical protein
LSSIPPSIYQGGILSLVKTVPSHIHLKLLLTIRPKVYRLISSAAAMSSTKPAINKHIKRKLKIKQASEIRMSKKFEPITVMTLYHRQKQLKQVFYYYYYYYHHLWFCSPARAMASLSTRFLYHTQRGETSGRTPLDE